MFNMTRVHGYVNNGSSFSNSMQTVTMSELPRLIHHPESEKCLCFRVVTHATKAKFC